MSVKAYVLIQTDAGKAGAVARSLRDLDGVSAADEVIGPYDVVATVETADISSLGRLVSERLQTQTGITRTLTCAVSG